MRKYKIEISSSNRIDDYKIEICQYIISSDIPYYLQIEDKENNRWKIINKYMSSNEKLYDISTDEMVFLVGKKSGKVYEISIKKDLSVQLFKYSIKKFIKQKVSVFPKLSSREFDNIIFSTNLLKTLYTTL